MRGPRERLRVAVKAPLVAGSTGGLYVLWRALDPAARRVGAEARLRALVFRAWAAASEAIFRVDVEVEGTPPRGPCLLVANHLTYFDIALLARRHDCVFVSMAEVQGWAGMGTIATQLDTIFVQRDKRKDAAKAAEAIAERLARGQTVVLFPEGRAGDGSEIGTFKSPLLAPAADQELPVAWAAVSYAARPGEGPTSTAVCWSDDVSFGAHMLGMMRLSGVKAKIVYGDAPIQDADRKRLAKKLEDAVRAAFVPAPDAPRKAPPPPRPLPVVGA